MSRGAKWHQGRVTPGMPGVTLISCMCYMLREEDKWGGDSPPIDQSYKKKENAKEKKKESGGGKRVAWEKPKRKEVVHGEEHN